VKKIIPLTFLVLIVLLSSNFQLAAGGEGNSAGDSSRESQMIFNYWFTGGNDTISASFSISYSKNFDGKIFNISRITADDQYHYFARMNILNTGTIYQKVSINFIGPMVLYNYKETNDEDKQLIGIGERPNVDDASMKIFVNENSTENKNFITFSSDEHFSGYDLGTIAPTENISLYFYIKSYNKILSGEYKTLSDIKIQSTASTGPVFNPSFQLLDIKNNEFIFKLDFFLVLSSDLSIGDINVSFLEYDVPRSIIISPILPQKSNYHLNINLKTNGDSFLYPFDEYTGVIELNAINSTNTRYINYSLKNYNCSKTTAEWQIKIFGKGNCLYFSFSRNHEIPVFEILFTIGIILLILRCLYIIYIGRLRKKLKNKKLMNSFFHAIYYVGEVISIPFYLGVIVNYIVYYCPTPSTIGSVSLAIVSIIAIILGAWIFVIGKKEEKEKEKTIMKIWSRRVKR